MVDIKLQELFIVTKIKVYKREKDGFLPFLYSYIISFLDTKIISRIACPEFMRHPDYSAKHIWKHSQSNYKRG